MNEIALDKSPENDLLKPIYCFEMEEKNMSSYYSKKEDWEKSQKEDFFRIQGLTKACEEIPPRLFSLGRISNIRSESFGKFCKKTMRKRSQSMEIGQMQGNGRK